MCPFDDVVTLNILQEKKFKFNVLRFTVEKQVTHINLQIILMTAFNNEWFSTPFIMYV